MRINLPKNLSINGFRRNGTDNFTLVTDVAGGDLSRLVAEQGKTTT